MTLDEAIEHATQVADSYKNTVPDCDCARDHRQLAEWLKKVRVYEKVKKRSVSMIRKLKEENDKLRWKLEVLKAHGIEIVDAVAGGYEIYSDDHKEAERLKAENAKLSNQLADVTESMGRVEERCAKLRERLLESREANEHLFTELRRYKSIFRMKPRAMNALFDENSKLRKLTSSMYKNMQGVLLLATDTVFVNRLMTLRECMDEHMESMAELGMPPSDYESRMRELRGEVG